MQSSQQAYYYYWTAVTRHNLSLHRSRFALVYVPKLHKGPCARVGLHWSISPSFLKVLALESVGVGPDVGETHGGVEAEEDDERYTDERDDAPRPLAVVLRVGRHRLRLLHLNTRRAPSDSVRCHTGVNVNKHKLAKLAISVVCNSVKVKTIIVSLKYASSYVLRSDFAPTLYLS